MQGAMSASPLGGRFLASQGGHGPALGWFTSPDVPFLGNFHSP